MSNVYVRRMDASILSVEKKKKKERATSCCFYWYKVQKSSAAAKAAAADKSPEGGRLLGVGEGVGVGGGAVRRRNSKPSVRGGPRASVKGQLFQPIKGQRQRLLPGRGGRKLGLGGGGEGSYQCKPGAEVSGRRRFGAPFSVHFFFRTPRLPPGGLGMGEAWCSVRSPAFLSRVARGARPPRCSLSPGVNRSAEGAFLAAGSGLPSSGEAEPGRRLADLSSSLSRLVC